MTFVLTHHHRKGRSLGEIKCQSGDCAAGLTRDYHRLHFVHIYTRKDGCIDWHIVFAVCSTATISVAKLTATQAAAEVRLRLHAIDACVTLNHMVQYSQTRFDTSFAALADVTRRGVLEQLGRADASITELADKFRMTLTGMKKHVGILEQAGLVTTQKIGRVRTCTLGRRRLHEEAAWIEKYHRLWEARFDELDKIVDELKRKEKFNGRKTRK